VPYDAAANDRVTTTGAERSTVTVVVAYDWASSYGAAGGSAKDAADWGDPYAGDLLGSGSPLGGAPCGVAKKGFWADTPPPNARAAITAAARIVSRFMVGSSKGCR
jgi:hypothetical protein